MQFDQKVPPREFNGAGNTIKDHGDIQLDVGDQVTFVTPSGRRSDFTALPWGFYLTNSLNGRCSDQGFKTALVKNKQGRFYLNLVEIDQVQEFVKYVSDQDGEIVAWLDEGP